MYLRELFSQKNVSYPKSMLDSYKHKGLRKKLVEELGQKGIEDERVLKAIGDIPRHLFIDSSFLEFAYQDKAFPIGEGQTISQPYTVAVQSQLLDIQPTDKILEVGTGSGYQARVLDLMGAKVYTVERQRALFIKTKKLLSDFKSSVRCFYGDGYAGLPAYQPFDKIIVTCGAPYIPDALVAQLKVGGILVVPIGDEQQTMIRVKKETEAEVSVSEHGNFRFVPMLEEKVKG